MVVECTSCHAKYNVDENKLPPAGVKVRCHKCQNIIIIKKPIQPPAAEPVAPSISEPPVQPPPPVVKTPDQEVAPPSIPEPPKPVIEPPAPEVIPPQPEIESPAIETPQPAPPQVAPPTITQGPPLIVEPPVAAKPSPAVTAHLSDEDKKWHERAKRLAKALASDLVLYNQAKVEQGLREGTLVQLLGSEIRRSWEYYCQQIPKHIVENTDYFKEQLNKVVGKGKELFK